MKKSDVIFIDELMSVTEQTWPKLLEMLKTNDLPEPLIRGTKTICWNRHEIFKWMNNYVNKVNTGKTKYYGIRKGAKTGVFTNWAQVKNLIHGYPYAKYKGFSTRQQAENYVKGK